jgi:transcriptional regulator GlxA family with amidase domain
MNRAKELLLDPRRSVKEVSAATGYTAASNFIRDFRAIWGMTPKEYRLRGLVVK